MTCFSGTYFLAIRMIVQIFFRFVLLSEGLNALISKIQSNQIAISITKSMVCSGTQSLYCCRVVGVTVCVCSKRRWVI